MRTPSALRRIVPVLAVGALVLAACGSDDDSSESASTDAPTGTDAATDGSAAPAGDTCGDTITEGTLTIATGEPAFFPWVIDDAPESGEGFEAAVAYAVAEQMGYDAESVEWVRTSFDEAIAPGAKSFDLNLQQFSITEERKENVDRVQTTASPSYPISRATASATAASNPSPVSGASSMTHGKKAGSPVAIVSTPSATVSLQDASGAAASVPVVVPSEVASDVASVVSVSLASSSLPHAASTSTPASAAGSARPSTRERGARGRRTGDRRMSISFGLSFTLRGI